MVVLVVVGVRVGRVVVARCSCARPLRPQPLLLISAPFPVQDSFKEPKELGECLLTACHEEKCRGGRFADAKRCCGIGKEGAAMVRDLLAANDVAWTLIDSGVVDGEWDLFKLFKEHRI